jgi:hypothetical protein
MVMTMPAASLGKQTLTSGMCAANTSSPMTDNGGSLARMLATPAPGFGDPAVSYLLSLSLPEMLDELADAVTCGHAAQLETRVAAAPPILSAALQSVVLAQAIRVTRNYPALHRTGAALDLVSREQQIQILAWMLHRHGVSLEATRLVEGVIAMRDGGGPDTSGHAEPSEAGPQDDDDQQPGEQSRQEGIDGAIASVQSTASGMPAPIVPEKWAPGNEPL